MTELEAALRDALSARATAVLPDADEYDAMLRRRGRRRVTRRAALFGALAAVAGVLVVAGRATNDARPLGADATRVIVLQYHSVPGRHGFLGRAVVLDTGALGSAPLVATAEADGEVARVAAVGDGRTFYAASSVASCHFVILRITTSGVSVVTRVDGSVTGLAASRDGRRLAYSVRRDTGAGTCHHPLHPVSEIRLRDLKRGTERTWSRSGDAQGPGPLALSPDGRTIAYDGGIDRLDTRKQGSAIPRGTGGSCGVSLPASLPTGEIAAVVTCNGGTPTVAVVDPVGARIVRTLFRLPANEGALSLAFAPVGSAAYVVTQFPAFTGIGEIPELRVYAWHDGGNLTRVDAGAEPVGGIAW